MSLTVAHVRLLDAAVVCNVLALGLLSLDVQSGLPVVLLAVLVHNALGALDILLASRLFPPIVQVSYNGNLIWQKIRCVIENLMNDLTICIILTTLVIESMSDFMANDATDGAKVQVSRHLNM